MPTDPHPEHRIGAGIRGWLETPASTTIAPGFMIVSGWAFWAEAPLERLWVEWLGTREASAATSAPMD